MGTGERRPGPNGYLLGVDPLAPDMHERLADALTPLGVPARLLGPKAEAPAVRVTGKRRLEALLDLIGDPPPGAEAAWPTLPPEEPMRLVTTRDSSRPEAFVPEPSVDVLDFAVAGYP